MFHNDSVALSVPLQVLWAQSVIFSPYKHEGLFLKIFVLTPLASYFASSYRHLIGKSRSLVDPTIFLNYHMSTVCFFDEKRALHQRHEFSVGKLNYQKRSTRMFTSLSAKDWVICECNIKRKESDASPSRHVTRRLIWRPPTLQVSME